MAYRTDADKKEEKTKTLPPALSSPRPRTARSFDAGNEQSGVTKGHVMGGWRAEVEEGQRLHEAVRRKLKRDRGWMRLSDLEATMSEPTGEVRLSDPKLRLSDPKVT
eukprot:3935512-Rhodomonas_salina.1